MPANNLEAFIPERWSRKLIEKLRMKNLAMAVMANRDYEGEIKQAGDTVHVRTVGRITMNSYTRGLPITYEGLAPTRETMTINDAKYFAFAIDDLDVAQSEFDVYDAYTREALVSFDETIDTKIFGYTTAAHADNRISNGGSAIDISATGSGTAVYELLVDAGARLDAFNVPGDGRWVVITPYVRSLLAKDTKYLVRATTMGDSIVTSALAGMTARTAPNYVGNIAGFDVYWSNNLPKDGANYYLPYGQGRPVSYANQLQKVERIRLESSFGDAVRGLMLHDGKVFDEPSKQLGYIYVDNS